MIYVTGIGPGDARLLTAEVIQILKNSSCVIGTARQLNTVRDICKLEHPTEVLTYEGRLDTLFERIKDALNSHVNVCVLASGDPSFYGIGQWIKRSFPGESTRYLSGISSVQAMFNQIEMPMHDVYLTSVHGRVPNWSLWVTLDKLCILTDATWTPNAIAKGFLERGLNPMVYVGERLSYDDACITKCTAQRLPERQYEMCVVVIDHER